MERMIFSFPATPFPFSLAKGINDFIPFKLAYLHPLSVLTYVLGGSSGTGYDFTYSQYFFWIVPVRGFLHQHLRTTSIIDLLRNSFFLQTHCHSHRAKHLTDISMIFLSEISPVSLPFIIRGRVLSQ